MLNILVVRMEKLLMVFFLFTHSTVSLCLFNNFVSEFSDENVPLRAIARKSVSGVNKLVKMEEPVKWDPLPIPGRLIVRIFWLNENFILETFPTTFF